MKTKLLIYSGLLILIALSAYAVNPRDMKFQPLKFEPPEPVRFTTGNGMVVYFLRDSSLPVVTLSALFHGGSVQDPPDKIGLSELTSQLLRTGGAGKRTPDQVDYDLDFVGATISSGAAGEYFSLDMRALKKDADLGFGILADILQKPRFDSAKVAMELSNKKDEIRRQNDDPGDVTRRVFYQTIYAGHPYGYSPTLESIDKITRNDIVAAQKKFYNPDNCLLAISGDLTIEEVRNIVDRYFGGWPKGNVSVTDPAKASMQYKPGVYYAKRDINQAHIRLGYLSMDNKNPDRYAMDVLNFALGGGGFSSRLMGQVRTTAGLAYAVGSYNYNRPLMGCFFAYCQTKAEEMSKATQMMLDIIEKVKDSGITREEMDLAKESIINSFVFNYATPDQIASARALLEFYGFPADQLQKDLASYKAVTLDDCRRVAAKYLDTKDMAIVITGNKQMFDKPLDTFGPVTEVSLEIK